MKVVHVGPPLARTGGPPGVLLQLEAGFAQAGTGGHTIVLPSHAAPLPAPSVRVLDRLRAAAGRIKRRVMGPPRQYRPPLHEMRRPHGRIERYKDQTATQALAAAAPTLVAANDADLVLVHDLALAERLLATRRPGQQIWLVVHSPMPNGLYLIWNWALPELDWREIAMMPDVRSWTDWELDLWGRVDRVVMATPDALDELARIDERFRSAARMEYTLTGASAPSAASSRSRAHVRKAWRLPLDQPVGLFLGHIQPYRGFDCLMAGLDLVPDTRALPGTIAVAGPAPSTVPVHERVRALGPVQAVGELMGAVDFFVNVNRFNMFDLSLIEATQAGLPLLLHLTGGNRTFAALGAGHVALPDLSAAAVARGVGDMFAMSPAARATLGAQSKACYEAHLTLVHTARRHLALYDTARAAVSA
jgi:hypothetical protein